MTARRLDMAESATLNARAVTRRAYARLIRSAMEAGDKDAVAKWQAVMEGLEKKWREDG